jgi:hypothetical protein
MGDVFISYSSKDRARVEKLVTRLRDEHGITVWWDNHLPPGERWDDQIERAMEDASTVVILWSEASIASEEVKDEAYYARDRGKALPVRIENVRPPYRFLRIQGFDLIHDPPHEAPKFPALVDAVRSMSGMRRTDDDHLVQEIVAATQHQKEGAAAGNPGPQAPAPQLAPAPPNRLAHLFIAPALVAAGLLTIIAGQLFAPGAPGDWPTWLGVAICGLAFAGAFATSLSRAG